jgi:rhomboid protease GluP
MFGIWFLGPLIEAVLGKAKFVLCYFTSGCGGLLVAWMGYYYLSSESEFLLAGASAGVMGLVGVQGALSLRAYRRSGSIAAKAQLTAMGQVILLQMVFDAMVPQVSSVAHLGGAVVGFLVGWVLERQQPSPSPLR